jgi:phosphoketolase
VVVTPPTARATRTWLPRWTGEPFATRPQRRAKSADHTNELCRAYGEIRRIQKAAREGKPIDKPRWPMIILRSPKGWTGPPSEHGKQLLNK